MSTELVNENSPILDSTGLPEARQSSIVVAVRVRPFTDEERANLIDEEDDLMKIGSSGRDSDVSSSLAGNFGDASLYLPNSNDMGKLNNENDSFKRRLSMRPNGIWKIVDCVDNRMLIFDPSDRNPLNKVSESILNSMYSHRRRRRRNGNGSNNEVKFVFDRLFDQDSSQQEVYQSTTSSLLDSVLDGFNGTVFAYGATGCGKTYTVSGSPEQPGIIFQAMEELFQKIDELKDTKVIEISLSYLEIYNETIRDLLKPETPSKKLVIREDSEKKIAVANLSYHYPKTVQDVIELVIKGNINRTTSPTEANEVSSRSHAVLQIHIRQTNRTIDLTSEHMFGTLSIIDLAGSERAAATRNRGQRLYEGANINKSLLALGNCINALCISDGTKRTCHIPFRDSKLTRLLKFSLGGNCKTVMIVCVSPSSNHYDETLNTLKYANRAKEIKTKVIRNQHSLNRHVGSYLKMITEQKREIDELRTREQQMINLSINKYKIANEKIEIAINDIINNIQTQYNQVQKYQTLKTLKSLTLVKRRFLQLVKMEIENVLSFVSDWTDIKVFNSCKLINDQLVNKIHELENKFDSPDELNMVIENARKVDLIKLTEMEHWDNLRHLPIFELKLDHLSESLRNEILINSSLIIEKLFESSTLTKRFKFLSHCLATEQDIYIAVQDLVMLDEEFDDFSRLFLNNEIPSVKSDTSLSPTPFASSYGATTETTSQLVTLENNQETEEDGRIELDKQIEQRPTKKKLRWMIDQDNSMMNQSFEEVNTSITQTAASNPTNTQTNQMDIDVSMQDSTMVTQDSILKEPLIHTEYPKTRVSLLNYKFLPTENNK